MENQINQEEKALNLFQRLTGIITNPKKTFEDINEKPKVFWPLIVIMILQLISTLLIMPKLIDASLIMIKKTPNYTPGMEGVIKTSIIGGTIFGAVLMPIVVWLIVSGLLKLFTTFTGDDGNFKNIFTVNIFAHLPVVIGGYVKALIIYFINPENITNVQTSLALLLPAPAEPTKPGAIFTFLSAMDVFSIWNLILLTIGTAIVFKISNKKAGFMVFGIFLIYVLAITVISAVTAKIPIA